MSHHLHSSAPDFDPATGSAVPGRVAGPHQPSAASPCHAAAASFMAMSPASSCTSMSSESKYALGGSGGSSGPLMPSSNHLINAQQPDLMYMQHKQHFQAMAMLQQQHQQQQQHYLQMRKEPPGQMNGGAFDAKRASSPFTNGGGAPPMTNGATTGRHSSQTNLSANGDNSNMSFTNDADGDDDNTSVTSSCDDPSSPGNKQSSTSTVGRPSKAKSAEETIAKLVQIGASQGEDRSITERRLDFYAKLKAVWEENAIECREVPTISKIPVDLFRLYLLVRERGGFGEVVKHKLWKDLAQALNLGSNPATGLNVRKKYIALGVLHLECRHDMNGLDPQLLIDEVDRQVSKGKGKMNRSESESSLVSSPAKNPPDSTEKKKRGPKPKDKSKAAEPEPSAGAAKDRLNGAAPAQPSNGANFANGQPSQPFFPSPNPGLQKPPQPQQFGQMMPPGSFPPPPYNNMGNPNDPNAMPNGMPPGMHLPFGFQPQMHPGYPMGMHPGQRPPFPGQMPNGQPQMPPGVQGNAAGMMQRAFSPAQNPAEMAQQQQQQLQRFPYPHMNPASQPPNGGFGMPMFNPHMMNGQQGQFPPLGQPSMPFAGQPSVLAKPQQAPSPNPNPGAQVQVNGPGMPQKAASNPHLSAMMAGQAPFSAVGSPGHLQAAAASSKPPNGTETASNAAESTPSSSPSKKAKKGTGAAKSTKRQAAPSNSNPAAVGHEDSCDTKDSISNEAVFIRPPFSGPITEPAGAAKHSFSLSKILNNEPSQVQGPSRIQQPSPTPFNINNILGSSSQSNGAQPSKAKSPFSAESQENAGGVPAAQSAMIKSPAVAPSYPSPSPSPASSTTSSMSTTNASASLRPPSRPSEKPAEPATGVRETTADVLSTITPIKHFDEHHHQQQQQQLKREDAAKESTPGKPSKTPMNSSMNGENSNMSFTNDADGDDDNTSVTSSCDDPSSPGNKQSSTSTVGRPSKAKSAEETIAKLVQIGASQGEDRSITERRLDFYAKLKGVWEENVIECREVPTISKVPVDLFRLYLLVRERGGFGEVVKHKLWKDLAQALNLGSNPATGLNVRKKYIALGVLHLECRHDMNGLDPQLLIDEVDRQVSKGKGKMNRSESENGGSQPSTPTKRGRKKKDKSDAPSSVENTPKTGSTPLPSSENGPVPAGQAPNVPTRPPQMAPNPPAFLGAPNGMPPSQMMPPPPAQMMQQPGMQMSNQAGMPGQQPQFQQNYYAQQQHQHQQRPPMPYGMAPQMPGMMQQQMPGQRNPNQMNEMMHQQHMQQMQQQQQQQYGQPMRYPPPASSGSGAMGPGSEDSGMNKQQQQQQQQQMGQPMHHMPQMPLSMQQQLHHQQHSQASQLQQRLNQPPLQMPGVQQQTMPTQQSMLQSQLSAQMRPPFSPGQQQFPMHQGQMQPPPMQPPPVQPPMAAPQAGPVMAASAVKQRSSSTDDMSQMTSPYAAKPPLPQQAPPPNKVLLPPAQLTAKTPQPSLAPVPQAVKEELVFPPGSVEAILPAEPKKRKICAKNIGPCDPWRLFMSLKSGLLAESTWALDALNILLYDDNSVAYFHLSHFPGLVNILLEHFLKCLKLIFNEEDGEFADMSLNEYSRAFGESDDFAELYASSEEEEEDEDDETSSGNRSRREENPEKENLELINQSCRLPKNVKINFASADSRRRFMRFNKPSTCFADYNACFYAKDFNLRNMKKMNKAFGAAKNDGVLKTEKGSKAEPKLQDLCRKLILSKNRKELDSYLYSCFSSGDEITELRKMFYGDYYDQRVKLEKEASTVETETDAKTTANSVEKEKTAQKKTNSVNEEFVNRHRSWSSLNGASEKKSKRGGGNFYYDDQISSTVDEEAVFKLVNQRENDLISRCTSISTILRNLSFVPGNDVELCKYPMLLEILARLLVLKHRHQIVICKSNIDLDAIKSEQARKAKSAEANDDSKADDPMKASSEAEMVIEESDEEEELDENELDELYNRCVKKLMNKKLFYRDDNKTLKFDRDGSTRSARSKINGHANGIFSSSSSNENDQHTRHTSGCKDDWWLECVELLRENTLVTVANIASALNLNSLDESVIELYAHGLVHWSICRSQEARDPFPTMHDTNMLTPQRLAIEALSKMSINEVNVDLVLSTISTMRPYLEALVSTLCNDLLVRRDDETLREFAIVLLTALAKGDQFAARIIAKYSTYLISFIEDFEEQARRIVLMNPGPAPSPINEDNLGTTVDMLRRCAGCLVLLASQRENLPLIVKHETRLLELITSQFVDLEVNQQLSEVLFACSMAK